jgi:hypothetical protein
MQAVTTIGLDVAKSDDFEVESEPRVLQPQCQSCGTSMLLIGREPHPVLGEESELRTFQYPACRTFAQVDRPVPRTDKPKLQSRLDTPRSRSGAAVPPTIISSRNEAGDLWTA